MIAEEPGHFGCHKERFQKRGIIAGSVSTWVIPEEAINKIIFAYGKKIAAMNPRHRKKCHVPILEAYERAKKEGSGETAD
jgi:hypothetical protein